MLDVHSTCTQGQFGELVGISQQAVSEMLQRGVIKPGDSVGVWIIDYVANLREQAAGRGSDGRLADARTRLAEEQQIKLRRHNLIESGKYIPVSAFTAVLSDVSRKIVSVLEPLPTTLHKRCPALTPEDLKYMQREIAKTCDLAVSASLSNLEVEEETGDVAEDVELLEETEP